MTLKTRLENESWVGTPIRQNLPYRRTKKTCCSNLSNEQEWFNSLAADFDSSDAIQDANDQLYVVKGQGQTVWPQLLIQIHSGQVWKEINKIDNDWSARIEMVLYNRNFIEYVPIDPFVSTLTILL